MLSLTSIIVSAALTILFPAVEIPPVRGRYNVGIVDLHLPVKGFDGHFPNCGDGDNADSPSEKTEKGAAEKEGFVSVRLLYPTLDPVGNVPYFDPGTAGSICAQFIKTAAPPPMKKLTWLSNHWKLSRIRAARNAKPVDFILEEPPKQLTTSIGKDGDGDGTSPQKKKIPIVAISHGILGNASIYSYQMMNLASNGSLVVLVDHTDGSAVLASRHDGSHVHYRGAENVHGWRRKCNYRTSELLAAIQAVRALDAETIPQLDEKGVSFIGRLDLDGGMVVAGHSFGAATAIEVAARAPDFFVGDGGGVVAYDPALDWTPDFGRRALFEDGRLACAGMSYCGGTGGYVIHDEEIKEMKGKDSNLHDIDMLFLYSHEFVRKGWGEYPLIKTTHSKGQLGRRNRAGLSDVGFI